MARICLNHHNADLYGKAFPHHYVRRNASHISSMSVRMDTNRDKIIAGIIALVLIVLAFSSSQAAGQKDGLLKIYFLNVGQGDAIFIEAPNGNQVLVDGGPDSAVIAELARVMPFYDRSIDAVVVSHPHSDHIAGLIDVLKHYDVGYVIQAGEQYDSLEFRSWQEAVAQEHTIEIDTVAGKQINLGPEMTFTIIHPLKSVLGTATDKPHDDNVVAMLQYKHVKVLLAGDMEAAVERILVNNNIDIDADVLKVGHHGSKTSTALPFLDAVTPQAAIIQVGVKNRYKHPAELILSRLENFGATLYRTDTDGMIRLISDGTSYYLNKQ